MAAIQSILELMTSPFGLAYKSTLKKQYFIVSEPKGEIISSKIGSYLNFKIQMGTAGSIFEPHF